MKRTVTVLQDDIDQGYPCDTQKCPVARAVRRDLADLFLYGVVSVTGGTIYFGVGRYLLTPAPVADFVDRFDRGLPVEAFKFEVEVPE